MVKLCLEPTGLVGCLGVKKVERHGLRGDRKSSSDGVKEIEPAHPTEAVLARKMIKVSNEQHLYYMRPTPSSSLALVP